MVEYARGEVLEWEVYDDELGRGGVGEEEGGDCGREFVDGQAGWGIWYGGCMLNKLTDVVRVVGHVKLSGS